MQASTGLAYRPSTLPVPSCAGSSVGVLGDAMVSAPAATVTSVCAVTAGAWGAIAGSVVGLIWSKRSRGHGVTALRGAAVGAAIGAALGGVCCYMTGRRTEDWVNQQRSG